MIFNGEANEQDLYHEALHWIGCGASGYSIEDFTRGANHAVDAITTRILRADRRWQYQDKNQTKRPIATTDLISGQEYYKIAASWRTIWRVRVKDSSGNWQTLKAKDRRQMTDSDLARTGTPETYDKIGNEFLVNPTPNYGSSGGFEVEYQKGGVYFTTTDTTETPGFDDEFHWLVAWYPARDECAIRGLTERYNALNQKIQIKEGELEKFYPMKDMDDRPSLTLAREDYGGSALAGRTISEDRFNI